MKMNILTLLTPKTDLAYLTVNMTIRQGLEKFRIHGYSAVPVLNDDGTYYGIIKEGDFLWNIVQDDIVSIKELEEMKIKSIARKNVEACKIDTTIEELTKKITNNNFVPIVDDRNILMGIITRKSVINYLLSYQENLK